MPETLQRNYQSILDMEQERRSASWKKFFVIVEGRTNDAHLSIVRRLECIGHTRVRSLEESDYHLVFCPIASRVGTDISQAMENIPRDKPVILVVMHHTFNRDHVVNDSGLLVENPNVRLTVDCLFHEGDFLRCDRNDIAWFDIQTFFGASPSQVSKWQSYKNWLWRHRMGVGICLGVLGLVITVTVIAIEMRNK